MSDAATYQRQNETTEQIRYALRFYFELEAACAISNGEAFKLEMKKAEAHVVALLTRIGGRCWIGPCMVSAHEAFEGERLLGRWFVVKGPSAELTEAANTSAHTRLQQPWRRGLWIEAAAIPKRS
jgi:hypothetical protein